MGKATWIDEPAALQAYCGRVGDVVAVDTESDHFHAYNAQVCLVQLASQGEIALVDPLALSTAELEPLFDLLADRERIKVMHAGRNDVLEIHRDWGRDVVELFDTQIAARFLHLGGNSLDFLLQELLGVSAGPSFQKFDWTTRPLPPAKADYAAGDVRHLSSLRERLSEMLREEGWLEAFHQQCQFVASSRHQARPFDPSRWRRIRGTGDLDGPSRRALRALFRLRHEICSEVNRAALHVFPNKAIVQLARSRPTHVSDLSSLRGLPESTAQRWGEQICECIRSAQADDTPARRAPKAPRTSVAGPVRARYKRLKKWRNRTADELGIPGEFIATNATLMSIAEEPPASVAALNQFDPVLPWHAAQFGDELIACL